MQKKKTSKQNKTKCGREEAELLSGCSWANCVKIHANWHNIISISLTHTHTEKHREKHTSRCIWNRKHVVTCNCKHRRRKKRVSDCGEACCAQRAILSREHTICGYGEGPIDVSWESMVVTVASEQKRRIWKPGTSRTEESWEDEDPTKKGGWSSIFPSGSFCIIPSWFSLLDYTDAQSWRESNVVATPFVTSPQFCCACDFECSDFDWLVIATDRVGNEAVRGWLENLGIMQKLHG